MSIDITKLLTLGVFDYKTISNMLSATNFNPIEEDRIKSASIIPLLTKPIVIGSGGKGKISVRLARAWSNYWDCVSRCRNPTNIDKECPGCNSRTITNTPPSPPSFPCCSDCVRERCVAATGNPQCSLGGEQSNAELLLIAQTLCYRDSYQNFLAALDCYECVINARVECGYKCSAPAGPEPTLEEVTDVLVDEPDFQ